MMPGAGKCIDSFMKTLPMRSTTICLSWACGMLFWLLMLSLFIRHHHMAHQGLDQGTSDPPEHLVRTIHVLANG